MSALPLELIKGYRSIKVCMNVKIEVQKSTENSNFVKEIQILYIHAVG